MDQPPSGEKHLSLTNACTPRRIPVSRPERYEVDDTPLSPPGSSSYLLFDSSTVFNNHPHKYRVLIGSNLSGKKDESWEDSSAKHKPLSHRRSKSAVSLPALERESEVRGKEEYKLPPSGRADQSSELFLKPKNLPLRKVSDTVVPSLRSNVSSLIEHSRRHSLTTEGEEQILEDFKDAVTLKEEQPASFQIEQLEKQEESMSTSSRHDQATAESQPTSEVASAKPVYIVKEVQPEPRRLFGFGPLYRPLPETVIEKHQPLTERIQKEGLTAVGMDSTDSATASPRKISEDASKVTEVSTKTTKLETNEEVMYRFYRQLQKQRLP